MVVADFPRSLLIVTTCSASKRLGAVGPFDFADLVDRRQRSDLHERNMKHLVPASRMYIGAHHRSVMQTVERLRKAAGSERVQVVILSAAYGVLDENTPILPYEATFADRPIAQIRAEAAQLRIEEDLGRRVAESEAAVFLLSEAYLAAVDVPVRQTTHDVYIAPPSFAFESHGAVRMDAGLESARAYGVAPRMARAAIFSRLADAILAEGWRAAVTAAEIGRLAVPTSPQLELRLS